MSTGGRKALDMIDCSKQKLSAFHTHVNILSFSQNQELKSRGITESIFGPVLIGRL